MTSNLKRRTTAEVLHRDTAGHKQCGRCVEWLPEDRFNTHLWRETLEGVS